MTEVLAQLLILGAATAAFSVTLAWTKVFEKPRDWVKLRFPDTWLSHLVGCHWCIAHWAAAAAVLATDPWPGLIGMLISWLAVTGLAGVLMTLILKE